MKKIITIFNLFLEQISINILLYLLKAFRAYVCV